MCQAEKWSSGLLSLVCIDVAILDLHEASAMTAAVATNAKHLKNV
jgi:hypothetical protein